MGRVYIFKDVLIPSSAEFDYGTDGSYYVASDQFNSNNCKSTVIYYVTVDGNHYGNFTLDDNTVGFILDGLVYGSEYQYSAQLPSIGNLSLNMFDWDANGGPSGWRWVGSSDAVVSIYYDSYFNNTELNNLWARLVNATEKLCGDGSWTGTGPIYEEGGYMTIINPSADEFVFPQDDINWGSQVGSLPIATTQLNKDVVYAVTNTSLSIIGYIEYKDNLSNTGIEGIHDALLFYTGLEHNTPPTKLADYMKGIAVAARYFANGYIDYTAENTLEQIVQMLEESMVPVFYGSITLDQNHNTGYITIEAENMFMNVITATLYGPTNDYTEELYSANGTSNTIYTFNPKDYWESYLKNMTDSGLDIQIEVTATQFINADVEYGNAGSASKTITYVYNAN